MADAGSLRSCLALKVSLVTRGTSLDHSSLGFFQRVLVSLDCYNKIPQTRGLMDNRKVFLGVLEAGNPMPRLWLIRCLGGGGGFLFLVQMAMLSLCPHLVERESDGLSPGLFL